MNILENTLFEEKLTRNCNISFVKLLIERDIKDYKYNIIDEPLTNYVRREQNIHLYNEIKKYKLTDFELEQLQQEIINTSKINLEIEYLPTEDWEFEVTKNVKELVISIPNYEMLSNALALTILVFPFASIFLSYFLIMIFR